MTTTETSPVGQHPNELQTAFANEGPNLRPGHDNSDLHDRIAGADPTSDVVVHRENDNQSSIESDVGPNFRPGHLAREFQTNSAGADPNLTDGHERGDAHAVTAVGDPPSDRDQSRTELQVSTAPVGPLLDDPTLTLLADRLDGIEALRIGESNRFRQLTRTEEDSDGEQRGFGLSLDLPVVQRLADGLAALKCPKATAPLTTRGGYGCCQEHRAEADLVMQLREHPLSSFQDRYRGLGEKQFARLLGSIGDPYWNGLHNRPRTVSELWAYSGLRVDDFQAVRRAKGQRANWSTTVKTRGYLVAEALMKAGHPENGERGEFDPVADYFRQCYDVYKAKHAGSVHPTECKRCGPAGKPAQPGSPRSAGHIHAMALRYVEKQLLKELWIAARDVYQAN